MARIMRFTRDYPALFGRCPRCMRQSFFATVLIGIVTTVLFGLLREVNLITGVAASTFVAAAALWVAHITAFAWRIARGKIRHSTSSHEGVPQDRRTVLRNFGQAFAAMALATSVVPVPRLTSADRSDPEPKRKLGTLLAVACWDGKCVGDTYCCQWGDDAWCCQNGTTCDPSVRGCF